MHATSVAAYRPAMQSICKPCICCPLCNCCSAAPVVDAGACVIFSYQAVEMKQVAEQDAERARFVVLKAEQVRE